jgi:hypothetical protein
MTSGLFGHFGSEGKFFVVAAEVCAKYARLVVGVAPIAVRNRVRTDN